MQWKTHRNYKGSCLIWFCLLFSCCLQQLCSIEEHSLGLLDSPCCSQPPKCPTDNPASCYSCLCVSPSLREPGLTCKANGVTTVNTWWCILWGLDAKRHCGSLRVLWELSFCRKLIVICREDPQAALWTGPSGEEIRAPANSQCPRPSVWMSHLGKGSSQPVSLQMTQPDQHVGRPAPWGSPGQNHSSALPNSWPRENVIDQKFVILLGH